LKGEHLKRTLVEREEAGEEEEGTDSVVVADADLFNQEKNSHLDVIM